MKQEFHRGPSNSDASIAIIYRNQTIQLLRLETGPKALLGLVGSIGTEPIDIEGLSGIKEIEVAAEVDSSQGFSLLRENAVKVRIKVRKVSR